MAVTSAGGASAQTNLDGLRAFAVSAVLLDHWGAMNASLTGGTGPWTILGHAGVIAFFVHTSLVLMLSLERMGADRRGLVIHFYLRRIFRIYPLAILTVLLVLALRIPSEPLPGAVFAWPGPTVIAANLLLIQNLIGRDSVLGPLWSLPYEIEMYALLPALFLIARRPTGPGRITGIFLLATGVGVAVQSLTGHANLLAYAPCFLCGVLAYALRNTVRPFLVAQLWVPFLALWFVVFLKGSPSDQSGAIAFQAGMSLLLCGAIVLVRDTTWAPWNRLTATVAKYSYGIYLAHFPAIWAVRGLWQREPMLGTLVWVLLTGVLSVLAYHLLEEPMIRLGRHLTEPATRHPVITAASDPAPP